jgi:hypothetical protein
MAQWTRCDLDLVERIVDDIRATGLPLPESVALLDLRRRQCEALRSYRPVPFPSSSQLATAWGWETRTVMRKGDVHRGGKPAVSRVKRLLRTEWQDPYFADAWTAYRLRQTPNKPATNPSQTDETPMTHPQDALNTGNLDKNKPATSQQQASDKPGSSHRRVSDADLLTATHEEPPQTPPEGWLDNDSPIERCMQLARAIALEDSQGWAEDPDIDAAIARRAVYHHNRLLGVVQNTTLVQAVSAVWRDDGGTFAPEICQGFEPTPTAVEVTRQALKRQGWRGTVRRTAIKTALLEVVAIASA